MNWDNLRYFLAVARTGSARSAAATLGVDQATIARRLHTLENELGTQLFYRQRNGYLLTQAGQLLRPEAEAMALPA